MGFFFFGRSVEDDEVGDEEDKFKLVIIGENFYGGFLEDWGSSFRDSRSFRKRIRVGVFVFL